MSTVSGIRVSLRISGDMLDPDEITQILGVAPSLAHRNGDRVPAGTRTVVRRTGLWTLTHSDDPATGILLDDAIQMLFARLPADTRIWAELGRRFEIDLFCGLFLGDLNQGTGLAPDTMRLLADRGIALDLDIYATTVRDEAT